MPTLKARLQRQQVDMWTATKAMMVAGAAFVVFVIFAQVQFWASSNARAQDKADEASKTNWDLQLQVSEAEISKLVACIDSVGTRADFRKFGENVWDLFDDVLVEAQAPEDPFLDRVDTSRKSFDQDFPERNIQDCVIPNPPIKPVDVPEDYNPPIPTIPEEYLQKLVNAGMINQNPTGE